MVVVLLVVAIAVLGIQPVGVQTRTLLITSPASLSVVVPPEAARVPEAVRLPVSWSMPPEEGSATSWERVSFLPLARVVSKFKLREEEARSADKAWSAWEASWEGEAELALLCRTLERP